MIKPALWTSFPKQNKCMPQSSTLHILWIRPDLVGYFIVCFYTTCVYCAIRNINFLQRERKTKFQLAKLGAQLSINLHFLNFYSLSMIIQCGIILALFSRKSAFLHYTTPKFFCSFFLGSNKTKEIDTFANHRQAQQFKRDLKHSRNRKIAIFTGVMV